MLESEKQYNILFEGVPIGLYRTTLSGQFLTVNLALVQLLGYPNREELMAASVYDIYLDADDRNQWLARIKRDGIVSNFEVQFRKCDGTIIWVRDDGKAVRDDNDQLLCINGNVQDITERKQAEIALQQSEEWHRTILQTTMDGFWIIDAQQDGRFAEVNEKYCRMSGYTRAELLTLHISDIDVDEAPDETAARIQRIIANGSEIFEARHRRKDGSVFNVEMSATLINMDGSRIICFCRDITRRKQVEEALRASEQRYRDVIEDQTEFICRFLPDGRITFINDAYCNYFWLNREEIIGKPHSVVLPPDDAKLMNAHLAALTPETSGCIYLTQDSVTLWGIRWQRWSDRAIFNANGEVIEYQSVGRDITEQKKVEIQLNNYKDTLEQRVHTRTAELSRANRNIRKRSKNAKKSRKS